LAEQPQVRPQGPAAPAQPAQTPQELSLRVLLQEMIQRGASDLHVTVGDKAKLRVDGDLTDSNINYVLAPKDTLALAYSILTENQKKRFETEDELDFSFGVQNLSRFRGNVYKQRGCVSSAAAWRWRSGRSPTRSTRSRSSICRRS
jgi:twitching motility protein PilT